MGRKEAFLQLFIFKSMHRRFVNVAQALLFLFRLKSISLSSLSNALFLVKFKSLLKEKRSQHGHCLQCSGSSPPG
jgi:hypothetical protein